MGRLPFKVPMGTQDNTSKCQAHGRCLVSGMASPSTSGVTLGRLPNFSERQTCQCAVGLN